MENPEIKWSLIVVDPYRPDGPFAKDGKQEGSSSENHG